MTDSWTPRGRFHAALRGEMPDRVPAIIWNNKLPGGETDQALLSAGVCVVYKSSVYDEILEGIDIETERWQGGDGFTRLQTTYHTPCGNLRKVDALYPGTIWHEKMPFRSPADYDSLIALVESRRFVPRYDRYLKHDAHYGASGIARPATEATPMRELIYELMGVELFARELFDRRDHVLALYRALLEARRRVLPILAASPAPFFIVEANVSFQITGEWRFREFYLAPIEEACDILHASGKLAGAHLDADNRRLAPIIAETSLDFIESFTPPPDCDLTLAEAHESWPNKALCCNFPSSVHLSGPEAVRQLVRTLLAEAAPGTGCLLGVIEDVPCNDTLLPFAEAVWEYGRTPIHGGV